MRATVAAAAMAPLALLALSGGEGGRRSRQSAAFVVPSSAVQLELRGVLPPGATIAGVRRSALEAEPSALAGVAGRCAIGGAALALLAGAAVRRRSAQPRTSRVGMRARGSNPYRPNAKGSKPMINRPITRNLITDTMKAWKKKYKGAGDIEDIMKKTIYGKVQFQWSSKILTDDIPIVPPPGMKQSSGKKRDPDEDIDMDAVLVRKYRQPAKFKKLEIVQWEMPENYTKSCTLKELVDAGVQYGHAAGVWNPEMLKYLYSDFDGTHIFDLVQTAAMLNRACYYAFEAASKGAVFLFVGTKQQAKPIIVEAAERTGMHYCEKYTGGLLTNYYQVQKGISKMRKMLVQQKTGAWVNESDKQKRLNKIIVEALWKKYKGVSEMEFLPDILIFVDEVKERGVINECTRIGIPTIGMIDSNSRPKYIDLPIPSNTSGSRSIELVIGKLTEAIIKGQQLRMMSEAAGNLEEVPKAFDPWIFSKDRMRQLRRRSLRQPWHKTKYGSYENFKKVNPYGTIPSVAPFDPNFTWPFPEYVMPKPY